MESIKVIPLGKKCLGIIPYVGQHGKIFFEIPIVVTGSYQIRSLCWHSSCKSTFLNTFNKEFR
jgi:hypothetical protein